jgi:hypothetical protein
VTERPAQPAPARMLQVLPAVRTGHRTRRHHHTCRRRAGRQKSRRGRSGRGIARDAARHGPAHGSGACRSGSRYGHRRR